MASSINKDKSVSRRKFLTLGAVTLAGGILSIGKEFPPIFPSIHDVLSQPSPVGNANGNSSVFCVGGYLELVDGHHMGLDRLFALMSSNGLRLLKSSSLGSISGPDGLISANDVVLIKVNCQWDERGGTNTDLVRGLIRTIIEHPDGFKGEIVVVDNGQGRGQFTWGNANAEDTTQCIQDVVNSFGSQKISTFLWDNIRMNRVQEYNAGDMADGYVLEDNAEPSTGMRFNYAKFKTLSGTYISLKNGIWDPSSNTYSNGRLKLINFPVLKTHGGAGVTACIKHYMGFISQSIQDNHDYIWNGGLAAEMAQVRFPTLNILDAIYVNPNPTESGKPGPLTPYSSAVKTNSIIAGLDPVAIDYWASKNVLIPAAKSLGYSSYSSLDPDTPNALFHNYLVNSAKAISAAGLQATMDPSRITLYSDIANGPTITVPSSSLASNALGRVYLIFNGYKYHITSPSAFNSYGLKWTDVKHYTELNPDDYQSSRMSHDYMLDGKVPLPNRPYIAGDANDGSLYYIPYYTWNSEKYPITGAGYNGYGGALKALPIRFGDPALSLPSSVTVLDGVTPIPVITVPNWTIGKNTLGRIFFIFNNQKYYFTDWSKYLGYGFKNTDINPSVNPDSLPSAQMISDYILEEASSVFREPLPNQPYIVGDVNDGSLYWVPYYTCDQEKYPITGAGYNSYNGQLKAMHIRYGDPSVNLATSSYSLDGMNPLPQVNQ